MKTSEDGTSEYFSPVPEVPAASLASRPIVASMLCLVDAASSPAVGTVPSFVITWLAEAGSSFAAPAVLVPVTLAVLTTLPALTSAAVTE